MIEETLLHLSRKKKEKKQYGNQPASIQALRIDVNNEFEVLYDFLDKLPGVLKPGGKLQSSPSIRRTNQ